MNKRSRTLIKWGWIVFAAWIVNIFIAVLPIPVLSWLYDEIYYRFFLGYVPGGWGLEALFFFILPPIGLALITSGIALGKGRKQWPWFLIGLFLGVIGLIIALVIDKDAEARVDEGLKKCPHCSEWVERDSPQCKYCLGDLPVPKASA